MSLWCGILAPGEAGECFLHRAAAGAGVRSCALPKGDQKQEKCASVLKVPCVGAASAQPACLWTTRETAISHLTLHIWSGDTWLLPRLPARPGRPPGRGHGERLRSRSVAAFDFLPLKSNRLTSK